MMTHVAVSFKAHVAVSLTTRSRIIIDYLIVSLTKHAKSAVLCKYRVITSLHIFTLRYIPVHVMSFNVDN